MYLLERQGKSEIRCIRLSLDYSLPVIKSTEIRTHDLYGNVKAPKPDQAKSTLLFNNIYYFYLDS